VKIRVDFREKASGIIDLLREEEITLEIGKVPYGDYIINEAITIERKTARDFLISIIDGRLFKQLSNFKKNCIHPLLLIEGNPFETDLQFDPLAIKGALVSTQAIWYIPIVSSESILETKNIFLMMGRQEETFSGVVPLRRGYRPKRLKSRQWYILQGLPQVGPTLARRFLDHFGSVSKMMQSSIEGLMRVEGVGKDSAKKIREVLDAEWNTSDLESHRMLRK
jgi:DNA excision repair protein ERCC-4